MRTRSLTQQETLWELARLRGVDYVDWFRRKHRLGESILVDIGAGVKGTVTVDGVTRDNLLLAAFGALWFGTLIDSNIGGVVAVDGISYTITTSGDVSAGSFSVAIGTGTTPPAMTDYTLTSRVTLSTSRSLGHFDTETQVIGTASADRSFSEVGIQQDLSGIIDTYSVTRTFLFARSLMSGGSGTPIVYRIRFQYPWVRNMAYIMYGIMTNSNVPVTDISGNTITARSSGEVNAGAVYLVGSSQQQAWSVSAISIPSPFSISTSRTFLYPRTYAMLIMIGTISPSTDTPLGTIGLQQPIYDTSGVSYTVLLGYIPLDPPVTLKANRLNMIFLRFLLA